MTLGAALLVALLSQAPAGARQRGEPPPARLKLEVRGDAACVTRADLAARIGARTSHVALADDGALIARVTISSAHPGKVIADLVLGGEPARRVTATSCGETADGLALIIAVTLDPSLRPHADSGSLAEDAVGAPPPQPRPRATAPSRPFPSAPAKAAPVSQPPPVTEAPQPAPVVVAPAVPPPAAGPERELDASLAGQTIFGPAPSVMPGIAVYVTAALDRPGPWAPALIVGAMHLWRSDLAERGGTASFTLDAGSLDACPFRVRLSRVTARPCLAALVGRLAADGSNTLPALSAARPFAAAGAALTASSGSTVQLSARLAAGITLVRDRYEFATDVFHRVSLFTISASIGVGVRWR